MKKIWIVFLVLAFVLAGCGTTPAPELESAARETERGAPEGDVIEPTAVPVQIPTNLPIEDNMLQKFVTQAQEDLASRLGIDISAITLVEALAVTWPDASLGCPQPGMVYKQVLQDGLLIVLEANGNTYNYHSGGNREPFLCQKTYKDPDSPPKIDLTDLTPQAGDKDTLPPTTPDNSIIPPDDGE